MAILVNQVYLHRHKLKMMWFMINRMEAQTSTEERKGGEEELTEEEIQAKLEK